MSLFLLKKHGKYINEYYTTIIQETRIVIFTARNTMIQILQLDIWFTENTVTPLLSALISGLNNYVEA